MRKNGRKKRKLERLKKEKKKAAQCIKQIEKWAKLAKCNSLERVLANHQLSLELKLVRLERDIEKLESQIEGNK